MNREHADACEQQPCVSQMQGAQEEVRRTKRLCLVFPGAILDLAAAEVYMDEAEEGF